MELTIGVIIAIVLVAFLAEYIDSSVGMGYGTTLTPLLLFFGFNAIQVVPAVLLSELVTGLLAGFTHHAVGNVDFRPKTMNIVDIYKSIRKRGIVESYILGVPINLKVVILISLCGILGTTLAVMFAISLPEFYLKLFIGILVFLIGVVILTTLNRNFNFSWKKVGLLGLIASFNKGVSGGGYGPVITSGQLLAGVEGKSAVGITSLSEGLTCLVGVIMYFLCKPGLDWSLAPYLVVGAVLSVPFAAITVKKINSHKFKVMIGIATIFLGLLTLFKLFTAGR